MEDKIKKRIFYLNKRIQKLEYRVKDHEELKLTNHGYTQLGRMKGSIISKEMEICFLMSLLEKEG